MRIAIKRGFGAAVSGFAPVVVACSLAYASPITQSPQNHGTAASESSLPSSVERTDKADHQAVKVKPADLTISVPGYIQKNTKPEPASEAGKSESYDPASQNIPQIPWEAIEQALKRENRPSSGARQEPKVVIGGEYQQHIINALPDLRLDIVKLQGPQNIPVLDFLRTQSAALSSEIEVYTSDLATPDSTIKMASNGNLTPEDETATPSLLVTTDNRPIKLKNILFWGLGLLVLYSLLDALFAKFRRQDPPESLETGSDEATKPRRRRRRRSFRRSRERHTVS